jgi:hypothetical protein
MWPWLPISKWERQDLNLYLNDSEDLSLTGVLPPPVKVATGKRKTEPLQREL